MATAERALELAGKADCGALSSDPYGRDDFDEIAAILRHYAEIMQAEAVGEAFVCTLSRPDVTGAVFDAAKVPAFSKLIIKPEPKA